MSTRKKYEPAGFWERTHAEVSEEHAGRGEGIRSVGGGRDAREAKYLYRLRESAFRRAAAKALADGAGFRASNILEFGCGSGYWLGVLPSVLGTGDFRYTGADISSTATTRLAARFPQFGFVCLGDPEKGWREIAARGPFDLALAIDVLYHITNDDVWRNSLRHIGSVMAPGGHLIFSDFGHHEPKADPSRSHVKHRAAQDYLDTLEQCGFSVVAIVPKFYLFNRVKYGPWRDHGAALSAAWRIADRFPPAMYMMYCADRILVRLVRPMSPRCKTRFFVCRKMENAE